MMQTGRILDFHTENASCYSMNLRQIHILLQKVGIHRRQSQHSTEHKSTRMHRTVSLTSFCLFFGRLQFLIVFSFQQREGCFFVLENWRKAREFMICNKWTTFFWGDACFSKSCKKGQIRQVLIYSLQKKESGKSYWFHKVHYVIRDLACIMSYTNTHPYALQLKGTRVHLCANEARGKWHIHMERHAGRSTIRLSLSTRSNMYKYTFLQSQNVY